MALEHLDKSANQPIVVETTTPSDGAVNTDRGLTVHADLGSTAADCNTNLASPSRQSLPSAAVDDFSVGRVEYCPPPEGVIRDFVRGVCDHLDQQLPGRFSTTDITQGFRQFLNVVISIQTKQANQESAAAHDPDPISETSA